MQLFGCIENVQDNIHCVYLPTFNRKTMTLYMYSKIVKIINILTNSYMIQLLYRTFQYKVSLR